MQNFTDWVNYWQQKNPWQSHQWSNASMGMFDWNEIFQQNAKIFQPSPDMFSFMQNFNPLDFLQQGFDFAGLKTAMEANDLETQKAWLKKLSGDWYQKNRFFMEKGLAVLTWQKQSLDMMFQNDHYSHFDKEEVKFFKSYCMNLNTFYDSVIKLIQNFDGLDEKVAESFIDKALSKDTKVEDVYKLFSVWADAFDQKYKELVFHDSYQNMVAETIEHLSNTKIALQKIVDKSLEQWDLPSRRELDTVHASIAKLRKENRMLNQKIAELEHSITAGAKK